MHRGLLDRPISLDGTFQGIADGIAGTGRLNSLFKGFKILIISVLRKVVSQMLFQFGMEGGAVVRMVQMREFVQEDVVLQRHRDPHQIQVQIDVSFRGAGAPVGGVMLDDDAVELKAVAVGQHSEPVRQRGFRLSAEGFDGLPFGEIGIPAAGPCQCLPRPFPSRSKKGQPRRRGDVEGNGDGDAAGRMDPDGEAAGPDALPKEDFPQVRVDMNFAAHGNKGTKSFVLSDFMAKFAGFFAGRSRRY